MKSLTLLAAVLFALTAHLSVQAQTDGPKPIDLAPRGTYAIRNARIVPVSGPDIERGTVVIKDGKITAVGAAGSVPAGAQDINGQGLTVYPGLIDAATSLGLVEIGQGAAGGVDLAEIGEMNPNAQAIIAVNPHSAHVRVTRVNGVTNVVSMPTGGTICGQAALLNLFGTTPREMGLVPSIGMAINFPRVAVFSGPFAFLRGLQNLSLNDAIAARDKQLDQLRKMLRDADAYGAAHDAYAKDKTLPRPERNVVLEALVPYVRGEKPMMIRVDRANDILAALRFSEEMKLKPIIVGGNEAWKVAKQLKERDVPVVVTGVLDLPTRDDDAYDVLYENAAKLQQGGVAFCISTGDSGAQVHDLPFTAGMAAAFGLDKMEALKSVTLYPAKILGVDGQLGSIEVGKLANLVVADGDILEARTNVKYVFIDGRQIPLSSRFTEFYEQFRKRK